MEDEGFVVRLRGLPWSATTEEVAKFFDGSQIQGGKAGIYLTMSKEGRPSGHGFVEFTCEEDVQRAIKKNKDHLGSRYVEVFRCKKSEMDWVVKRGGMDNNSLGDAIVKLRGLPFGCSKEEIAQFFTGLEIVPNGIMLPEDRLGRSTGEAFVQFASQDIAERALGKHKERIGHRYIEVFKSNMQECRAMFGNEMSGMRPQMGMGMGRPGPYDRNERFGNAPMGMAAPMVPFAARGRGRGNVKGFYEEYDNYSMGFNMGGNKGRGGVRLPSGPPGSHYVSKTGHSVHMRGMPFLAIEQDVVDFFSPLKPMGVQFEYGGDGRRTGGADVDFSTHQEALEAMKKHRSNMQHRYIELFLNSTANGSGGGGGGGGGYGGEMNSGFSSNNMGGGNFGGNNMRSGFSNNMGGGFGMGGGGGYGSGNFNSMQGQQFNNSSNGYGMGGGNMGGGNMGSNSGFGAGSGMNSSFMDGGGYSRMGGGNMGGMHSSNYTAF